MKLEFSLRAQKGYKQLSLPLKKKADKQFSYLLDNYRHPSLRTRKMSDEIFEGRIDYQYRFSFTIKEATIYLLTIGPHDTGLGKK